MDNWMTFSGSPRLSKRDDGPNIHRADAGAIDSDLFSGPVERINAELVLTLTLPHGPEATENQKFPKPIVVVADGPVALPQ